MIQFLIYLIEWIAVLALSIIGIEYTLPATCAPIHFESGPAQVILYVETNGDWSIPDTLTSDICQSTSTIDMI